MRYVSLGGEGPVGKWREPIRRRRTLVSTHAAPLQRISDGSVTVDRLVSTVAITQAVPGVQSVVVRGPTVEQIDPCVVYTDPQPVPVAT